MTDRKVHRGARFELVTETVELPNGRRATLDVVRHPGATAVVPFLAPDRVLLIRQYRHAVADYLLEVPAGKLDPGEAPEVCATRELEEETGYRAGRLEKLTSIIVSPGFTDEVIHLFAAFDLEETRQSLEPDEVIELMPMALDEALERVRGGQLRDAKSAMALLLAAERVPD